MNRVYTQTVWQVKPGLEDEFVRRWEAFADWCDATGFGQHETLLRDLDRPGRFISLHSPSNGAIPPWQTHAGYQRQLARLGELLEELDARALELVAQR